MKPETIQNTLGALRKAGSIFGVHFSGPEGDALFSDLAYTPERVEELTTILDDISYYFEQEERAPDTLSFSYDGGSLLILFREGQRLVVLHHNADEADFIAAAGNAFLKDYLVGLEVEAFAVAETRPIQPVGAAPGATTAPRRPVDPTTPITPVV